MVSIDKYIKKLLKTILKYLIIQDYYVSITKINTLIIKYELYN